MGLIHSTPGLVLVLQHSHATCRVCARRNQPGRDPPAPARTRGARRARPIPHNLPPGYLVFGSLLTMHMPSMVASLPIFLVVFLVVLRVGLSHITLVHHTERAFRHRGPPRGARSTVGVARFHGGRELPCSAVAMDHFPARSLYVEYCVRQSREYRRTSEY